jgi:hypothetical protein
MSGVNSVNESIHELFFTQLLDLMFLACDQYS